MPDIRLAGTPQDYSSTSGWPTISYTANTGNNRVVVAVVGYEHGAAGSSNNFNISMGAVPFTTAQFSIIGGISGGGAAALCYITESSIPAGAQTISLTSINPGSAGGGYAVTMYTLENVDQTTPIFYSTTRNTAISPSNTTSTISSTAGGFTIVTGSSGTVATQPFSTTDSTWTERRDFRNTANDYGFFIYDKLYLANKTENFKVDFSASGRVSSIVATFNPFVSNKVRFDTSANGYSFNSVYDSSLNTSIAVNVPTNVSNGDFMLGVVTCGGALNPGSISTPAGWTQLANNSAQNGAFTTHVWIGYKIANAEPISHQWDIAASGGDDLAWIFRITGHDQRYPIDSLGTLNDVFTFTNLAVKPVTTSNNDAAVVYIFAGENSTNFKANGTFVSPEGTTQVVHQRTRSFSAAAGNSIAYENRKFAGNTGTKLFSSYSINQYGVTYAFAIKQAPYSVVQAERLIETGKVKQFSDNFNRADTAIGELGPNWDVITGALRIINNQFDGPAGGVTSRAYAKVSESVVDFSDDHSAEITVAATRGSDFIGPAVRVTANGGYTLYCDGVDANDRRIGYITGTSARIVIGSVNIVPVAGDKLKITAQGSTITAYKNGVQVDQVSNTAWTTGQPGIFYDRTNVNGTKGDDFYAEDLNSPTSGTMVKMYDDGTIRAGYFSEKEYLDRIKYHYDGDVWAGKFIESE